MSIHGDIWRFHPFSQTCKKAQRLGSITRLYWILYQITGFQDMKLIPVWSAAVVASPSRMLLLDTPMYAY